MSVQSNVTPQQTEEYTRLGFWDKWTMCDFIKRWAGNFPDKEALIDPVSRLTWAEYHRMMERIALHFQEMGLKKGDLVVAQIPNCVEAVVIQMALARIGACIVPIAVQWREHELSYVLSLTEAPAVIVFSNYKGFDYIGMMRGLQKNQPHLKHIIALGGDLPEDVIAFGKLWAEAIEDRYSQDFLDKNCAIDANDVLTMCFTSGTEADPKGCPRTHNHWKSFVRSGFLGHLGQNTNDRVVMALPWINLFGQSVGVLSMAMVGGTLILLDGFDPQAMARTISGEKATLYAGVPAMHVALLNYPGLKDHDLSSLRVVASGGAPCPTTVIRSLMEAFGCLVWNGFGSNEGHLNVTELGLDPEQISTTIGIAQLHSQIKIVDENGRRLGPGQVGEYCQKAPFIISGYYKRPDLNRQKWDEEGFYHTGDACSVDENGFYRFVTRMKDIIIRGGMNISAEEVEFLLYDHPKILNVAIVGFSDPVLGEKACACVELKQGVEALTIDEIRNFMESRKVAKYKYPEKIIVLDAMPRTPTGKVLKYKLREIAAA